VGGEEQQPAQILQIQRLQSTTLELNALRIYPAVLACLTLKYPSARLIQTGKKKTKEKAKKINHPLFEKVKEKI